MEQSVKDILEETVARFCNGEKVSDDIIQATVAAAISVDGLRQGDEVELSRFQLSDPPISWRVKLQVEAGDVVRIVLCELHARDLSHLRVHGTIHFRQRNQDDGDRGAASADEDLEVDSDASTCCSSSVQDHPVQEHPLRGGRSPGSPIVVVTDHPSTIASIHRSAVSQVSVLMATFYFHPTSRRGQRDEEEGGSSGDERDAGAEVAECDEVSLQMLAQLSSDFHHLLTTRESCDVILQVGELPVKAHKAVLVARSEVFREMLAQDDTAHDDDMGQGLPSLRRLQIADAPRAAFLKVLRFVYTADVSELSGCETDVLVLAARYGLTDLAAECCRRLLVALDNDHAMALDLLAFAEQHAVVALKERALLVVVEHLSEVTATASWLDYMQRMPSLAVDILKTAARVLVVRKP